jgi:hypothetical protein
VVTCSSTSEEYTAFTFGVTELITADAEKMKENHFGYTKWFYGRWEEGMGLY